MLIPLVILTALSLLITMVGMAWALATSGESRRRSGEDVGRDIIADRMVDDGEEAAVAAQSVSFEGEATQVRREAVFSLVDVRHQIRDGQWREVLPPLLTLGGLVGLLVFGALTAWVAIESKLVAGLIVVVAVYAAVRIVLALLGK